MTAEKLPTDIRRDQIARAALSVIASHGVARFSVAAVARRVGLVPSALYRHFKGKDQVLDAVIEYIAERLIGNVRAVTAETDDPLERLHRLLIRHVRMIRENEGIPRIVFSEDTYGGQPTRKAKVLALIQRYLSEVAELVRDGQRKGKIRPKLAPQTVALMFLGLIQPAAILWHMSDGSFDVTRETGKTWALLHEAIRCP